MSDQPVGPVSPVRDPAPLELREVAQKLRTMDLCAAHTPRAHFETLGRAAELLEAAAVRGVRDPSPPEPNIARLEALVLEYTSGGECNECGAEVCRNVAHDADCVIGQVNAALRGVRGAGVVPPEEPK